MKFRISKNQPFKNFAIDDTNNFLYNYLIRVEAVKRNLDNGIPILYRTKKSNKAKGMVNSWYYFGLAGQIGFSIALPIAGGAVLGSYIDKRFESYPQYTIVLLFAGIILSMINFIIIVQSILKRKK
jgi:ATP synthase protein I